MNFTVVWLPAAEAELTEVWMACEQRNLVSAAAGEIDRLLGGAPFEVGESRDGTTRVLISAPLVVTYQASEADRIVWVASVRLHQKRRR